MTSGHSGPAAQSEAVVAPGWGTDVRDWMLPPGQFPAVEVRTGHIPPNLVGARARGVLWEAAPGQLLLAVPDVGRFLVEAGERVTIEPAPHAPPSRVARIARMTPLAALAWQRGMSAFHAAAAVGPEGAILLCGASGAGKSTLLAALLARGWAMLADDLAIVELGEDGVARVFPGFGELVLWADVIERLEGQRPAAPDAAGRCVIQTGQVVAAPQPLRAIHSMSIHHGDNVQRTALRGGECFRELGHLSSNTRIGAVLVARAEHLRAAAALAGNVPVDRLQRPRGRWSVTELTDVIAGDPSDG